MSAVQIPAGGAAYNYALSGDFNGDGKKDLITLVENYVNGSRVYSISAVLGKGDGVFKPPVLSTVSNTDPFLVGDLNGDGKDDLIQAHPGSGPSTVDVWLSNGDGAFTEGHSYQVSPATLQGGILADVNGDGKLDLLAIDSQTPGLVRTLLGNGDGTFQAATSITLPTNAPNNIHFADFNGDGKIDFAGTDGNGQVNVYVQAGGNYVLTGAPLATPDSQYNICDLEAGDLTGDGAAEIVTPNCSNGDDANTVTVYVNSGDGTFATGVYYAVAASAGDNAANLYPYAATVADVNGDGKNDIVVTNYYAADVTILTGNGDGTVNVPHTGYSTGGDYPYYPAIVSDFNGDGAADIVVIDDNYSYAYLQGNGNGTFHAALDYYSPISDGSWPEPVTVASGDFNGDGIKDFVVGNCCSNSTGITVFLSSRSGSLLPGVNYGSGGEMYNVAVADFDGDGKLDVVAADYIAGVVRIFHGNGDGTFTAGASYATDEGESSPWGLVVGDFNHDGHPDVAVANYWNYDVGVLLNDGAGGLLSVVNYSVPGQAQGIAAGDIDGDGYVDLLVTLPETNRIAVLKSNSDNSGTFQSEFDFALANGNASYNNPQYISVGDFNGDGRLDFAVTIDDYKYGNQGVAVALGIALPNGVQVGGSNFTYFGTPSLYSTTNQDFANFNWPWPSYVQPADINGDGILDLVYTNNSFSTAGVLLGNGNGTFGTPNEYPVGESAFGLAVADVNGDGALDVVTADYSSGEVTVVLNANGSQSSFTLGTADSSETVPAGSAATYNLSLTGNSGYSGTVTFSCSGLPAHASCSFSPSSIVASGSSQSTTLTISTAAARASLVAPALPNSAPGSPILWASFGGVGLFGTVLAAGGKKRNRRQMAIVLGILLLVMIFSLVGCGSVHSTSQSAGTPPGTYTVMVTARGTGTNSPTHSLNLTLIVQ